MSEETENTYLKTTAKGAGIVFFGLVVSKIISYLYRIFIARYFGPADYGIFSIAIAVLGFFSVFAVLGLQSGTTRYTAYYKARNDKKRLKGVILSSIKIVLPASILISFLMFISSDYLALNIFNEPLLKNVLIILSLSVPFSALFAIFVSVFIGFKEIKYRVYSESIFINLVKLTFIVILGILGFGIAGMAWAWTIAAVSAFFLSAYFLVKMYPAIRNKLSSIEMKKEMISYSFPLLLTGTMGFIILWIDTLMLGYFKTAGDVGIYNAAMPTAQLLLIFPNALIALFLPIITELFAKNKLHELESYYKTVTRWIFYIDFPIFLLLVFFSRQVLNLLFGPEYTGGYVALIILSTGLMLRKVAQGQMSNMLQMLKKTRIILYIGIIGTIIDVLLNYLLIPIYGMEGAALATLTTYITGFVLYLLISYRMTKMSPFSMNMLKSVIAGLFSVSVVYGMGRVFFTTFSVYVLSALFIAFVSIYTAALLLLRGFEKEDIEILKTVERKSGVRVDFVRRVIKRFI